MTGETGKLVALLDAILINGYGSKPAAGWGKPFGTGTSTKEVYRPATGIRHYVRVLDDGTMTGGFRDASVRAGESMSDIDTFTNPYPTAAQMANGVNWRKSTTANSTARPWIAFADDRTLYLFIQTGDNSTNWACYMFGDYYSYVPSDLYSSMLTGFSTFSASALSSGDHKMDSVLAGTSTAQGAHYIARRSPGTGASTNCYKKGGHGFATTGGATSETTIGNGILGYPNASDGGLYIHPIWVMDQSSPECIHGHLRGFFQILHAASHFGDGDTFSGAGTYTGRDFKLIKSSFAGGVYCLETSNTVDTN